MHPPVSWADFVKSLARVFVLPTGYSTSKMVSNHLRVKPLSTSVRSDGLDLPTYVSEDESRGDACVYGEHWY